MIVGFIGKDIEELVKQVGYLFQGQNIDVYIDLENKDKAIKEGVEQNADYIFVSVSPNDVSDVDKVVVVSDSKDSFKSVLDEKKRDVLLLSTNDSMDQKKEKILHLLLIPS